MMSCLCLPGCGAKKETVVIYTSAESYRVEHMWQRLNEEFPQYEILLEYLPTGSHAARLLAEGMDTDCDITYDLEYTYLEKLEAAGLLADLSDHDFSVFSQDVLQSNCYVPEYRNGGAVIINPAVLDKHGLDVPTCYDDLLKPEYQGLISMPNPTSSGTGYMFLLAMANARGEEAAFAYFDALAENVLQFTSSGSGPVNALIQQEVAIGLGITGTAVNAINEGAQLEIVFFEEGSPYALYGQAMIQDRDERAAVREVFDFLYGTYAYENCQLFYPEQIFANRTFQVANYPANITYCDMTDNTAQRKEDLLSGWKY
jgi:iron(III) transport system substrate-binding protein